MKYPAVLAVAVLGLASSAWAQEQNETAPADPAATQAELEAQMDEARQELQEQAAPAATGSTTPAAATEPGFEEIRAAPVMDPSGGTITTTTAAASPGDDEVKLGFGATVVLDHYVGSGAFVSNDALRSSRRYIGQTWDLRPAFTFPFMSHKLKASARFIFDFEYTTPDNAAGRRFTPSDWSVALSDAELFVEPLSGVTLDATVRLTFPGSYESINVKRQWGGIGGAIGATRTFGPVAVGYSLGATKYLNSSHVALVNTDVARDGDEAVTSSTALDNPSHLPRGFGNPSFMLTNTFDVSYTLAETLSITYSLAIRNAFKYRVAEEDELTSVYADGERGRSDQLWPTLEVGYALSDGLGDALPLPFKLSLAAGITSLHPAQKADNSGIMWPVFVQAFGANRAANNYGTFYFDVVGTY